MKQGTAIIIGAGPAGLTAAVELQRHTAMKPIVVEASHEIGGLARTVHYHGNRMDIGGHRFFSKSDRVMQWWLEMMPVQAGGEAGESELRYRGHRRAVPSAAAGPDPRTEDLVMLVRQRKSRIYFQRRFFDYPLRLNYATLRALGATRALRCGLSWVRSAVFPKRPEQSLEDFLINRFGRQLYHTFFKPYTEKVWGVPCRQIGAEWGAQRIKGLSLKSAAWHFLRTRLSRHGPVELAQKQAETSLIETFLYPKLGAGQLWEQVAERVTAGGGEIHFGIRIDRVNVDGHRVTSVEGVTDAGERVAFAGDSFISTMPVRDLMRAVSPSAPKEVLAVSNGLIYRDFITVGLLAGKLKVTEASGSPLRDNWIYVQDPDVRAGRVQIFNNWSPWLVASTEKTWIGLEYFCNQTDPIWNLSNQEMARLAIKEGEQIGIVNSGDVEGWHVVRVPKAYPAYFGSYDRFDTIRRFTDGLENLFLIGRNGMHKYNNQDHSMLTAMAAVENIVNGVSCKNNLWAINTEMDYHEAKAR